MNTPLKEIFGTIDIYLFDQILKQRYQRDDKILDTGCGKGRNMYWFYKNGYTIYGLDKDEKAIAIAQENYPKIKNKIEVSDLDTIPFEDDFFNHVISNAVLHFAESTEHFETMFAELVRVVKVNGVLFIRMTSNIGIENNIDKISEGVYTIPDGSTRFLLTKELLKKLLKKHNLSFIEPLKTVNVNDLRCMSTLVLRRDK